MGNQTDISDVLIAWGKNKVLSLVVLVIVVSVIGYVDHVNGFGILAAVGDFFVVIGDVLTTALAGVA